MKFTSKRLISILLVLAFALAMLPMTVLAANPETLYLVPNSNWLLDGARFAAIFANSDWSVQTWVDAVDSDGDGVYEIAVPTDADYTITILCRMNPNTTDNNWDNRWNQTSNLDIPTDGNNCYTVEGGTWDYGNGTWSTFTPGDDVQPEETPALEIEKIVAVGAGSGNFLYGVNWDPASGVNGAYETSEGSGIYSVTYMGIAAGIYEFKFAANGAWTYSWGTADVMESGVIYDAYMGGDNSKIEVGADNSTVTLNLDLSAIDENGNGATMWVDIEEPEVSFAPESMVLGENEFVIANGDSNAVSSTFTVEKDSVLVVNVTYMNTADGAVPEAYIPMQFGRMYALLVNGQQVWLPNEIEVFAGDVIEVGVQSYMGSGAEITVNLSMKPDYYVFGDATLCNGEDWNSSAEINKMVYNFESGLYTIMLDVYEAGTYEFRVAGESWESDSYSVTVKDVASTVTITFDSATSEVTTDIHVWASESLKFQLNADATADSETVDLRMIAWVDSLELYSSIDFKIVIAGQTATWSCDTVYTAINVSGQTMTCEDVFGNGEYLATFTLTDIPASYFDTEIAIDVVYTEVDGDVYDSGFRTIVLSDMLG